MKICKHCGEENPDHKNWCKKCMKPLWDDPAEALPLSTEKETSDRIAKSGIIRKTSDDSEKLSKAEDDFDKSKTENRGRIYSSMGQKNRSVSEEKPEKEASEQEGNSGLKGRVGHKEYGRGGSNSRIIRRKQQYCTRCGESADGEDMLCPRCRNRKKKTTTIWTRVVAAVLVMAMWSGLITLFVTNRTPKVKNAEQAISVLNDLGEEWGYENAFSELTEKNASTVDNENYYRLQQNYKGIPVYGKTVVCSTDSKGNTISITGNVADIKTHINLAVTITKDQIVECIQSSSGELSLSENDIRELLSDLNSDDLCIYVAEDGTEHLAYVVDIGCIEYVIDANEGKLLTSKYLISDATGYLASDIKRENGFYVLEKDGRYVLCDKNEEIFVYDLEGESAKDGIDDVDAYIFSDDNIFGNTKSEDGYETAAKLLISVDNIHTLFKKMFEFTTKTGYVLVAYNSGADFGFNAHGGISNSDGTGFVAIGTHKDPEKLDILGHEYGHVMCETHAGFLHNNKENRALEEGICDIFGIIAETCINNWDEPDWAMRDDDGLLGIYRNLENPQKSGHALKVSNWMLDDKYHYSTIISHSAYLMWNGIDGNSEKKIDLDTLAKLWYRAMLLMPSDCNFVECRTLVELAASNMNLTDLQKQCISEAFDRVGIQPASEEEYLQLVHMLVAEGGPAIKGTVYEKKMVDGVEAVVPISDATVTVYSEGSQKIQEELNLKNESGRFEIKLPAGTYSVSITADGYIGQTITFELDDNEVRYFSIEIKPKAVEVPIEMPTEESTESPTVAPTEVPAKDDVPSGKCGDNLTWTLDKKGKLTISGTGDMYDYDMTGSDTSPWFEHREKITSIQISNKATSIGDYAFNNCLNVQSITIPGSVKKIGNHAFLFCNELKKVAIENGVTAIGDYAFMECYQLTSIKLPKSVITIGEGAFWNCYLKTITIPANVSSIGDHVFETVGDNKLTEIRFAGNAPKFASESFYMVKAKAYYPGNNQTWTTSVLKDYSGDITWIAEGKTDLNKKALEAYRPIVEKAKKNSDYDGYSFCTGILIDLDNDDVQELVLTYLSAPFEESWWSEHVLSVYDYENGKVVTKLDGVVFGEMGGAGEDAYATILYKSGTPYVMTYNDFGETSPGGNMKPNRVGTMTIYDGKTCKEVGVYRIERWDNVMSYQINQRTVSEKEFVNEIEQYQGVDVTCDLYRLIEFPETFVTVSKLLQQMK